MDPPGTGSGVGDDGIAAFTSLRYDRQLLSSPANTADCSTSPAAKQEATPFYLLAHHRDRMLAAAEHFGYPAGATAVLQSLELFARRLQEAVDAAGGDGPFKLKPVLTRSGEFTVDVSAVAPVPLSQLFPERLPEPLAAPADSRPSDPDARPKPDATDAAAWQIALDTQPTPQSAYTRYKTTARGAYEAARGRAGIHSWAELREVVLWNAAGEATEGSLTSVYVRDGADAAWVTPAVAASGGQQGTTRRWALEHGLAAEGVIPAAAALPAGSWAVLSNGVRGFWGGWVA